MKPLLEPLGGGCAHFPLLKLCTYRDSFKNNGNCSTQATFDLPGGEIRKTEDEDKETDNIEVEDEARKPKVQKAIRRIKYRYPLTAKIPKIPLAVAIASSTEEKGQTVTRLGTIDK